MSFEREHVFRHDHHAPVEAALLGEHIHAGSTLLDVGTAATGRTARLCRDLGNEVVSIDYNQAAIEEFAQHPDRVGIHLAAADMTRLPFADQSLDHALIGFHGLDYLPSHEVRAEAFREFRRVVRPGGIVIFNSWNRVGICLDPRGVTDSGRLRIRVRYLRRGHVFRPLLQDTNGLRLFQSSVRRTIAEAEKHLDAALVCVADFDAGFTSRWRVALTSPEPYYVFRRSPAS